MSQSTFQCLFWHQSRVCWVVHFVLRFLKKNFAIFFSYSRVWVCFATSTFRCECSLHTTSCSGPIWFNIFGCQFRNDEYHDFWMFCSPKVKVSQPRFFFRIHFFLPALSKNFEWWLNILIVSLIHLLCTIGQKWKQNLKDSKGVVFYFFISRLVMICLGFQNLIKYTMYFRHGADK